MSATPEAKPDAVARFHSGDDDAFRDILMTWHARLQAMIAGSGVPLEDVPMVAQDTFLHVYDHINDFKPGTNFRAWLYAIGRNKARSWHEINRREQRNKNNAIEHFLQKQITESNPNLDERLDVLAECLKKLNKPVRDMVNQRYAGSSIRALSSKSGRSESAIKMSLLRARESLRDCVAGTS
jgi:RNA polymerase sigma-70 factor (ECF subfamily)